MRRPITVDTTPARNQRPHPANVERTVSEAGKMLPTTSVTEKLQNTNRERPTRWRSATKSVKGR